jgi:hypothetical protein
VRSFSRLFRGVFEGSSGFFHGRIVGEVEFGLVVFCAFDDGIDDVGLMAPGDLLADEIPDLRRALIAGLAGDDGRSPGGQLVEHAEVEVAVERERQGARDGRRGHHQDIGLGGGGLLHQAKTLQHAEAVLLVDDDEAEAWRTRPFLR